MGPVTTLEQILSLLIAERDRINRAIEALQEPTKHRGRPKKIPELIPTSAAVSRPGKRRGRSAAQRQAQAEKMRAYWAKRRKDAARGA
jgi:hypothetical protein